MSKENRRMSVRMGDEVSAALLEAVVSYEALSRGLSRAQALYELVREAAAGRRYPAWLRKQIEDVQRRGRIQAAQKALGKADEAEVA